VRLSADKFIVLRGEDNKMSVRQMEESRDEFLGLKWVKPAFCGRKQMAETKNREKE